MLIMLMTSVMSEEQQARRRTGCCSDVEPTGFSPPAVWAMKPVIVCMPSRGSRLRGSSAAPAASATIMVSPMARDMPSTTAAATPERAAGQTTRSVVCIRLAPIASDPWRSACGTAENGVLGQRGDRSG